VEQHHTERETFSFITGDFQCAWDALAEKPESIAGNRCNFMFALQAAVLLEWVGQLCESDPTARSDFATELQNIEKRYFTELDNTCPAPSTFTFPGVGPDPLKSLLCALWDLIRNGVAHQYQDITVTLSDGKHWVLGLQGVQYGWLLSEIAATRSSLQHLAYCLDQDGDLVLFVHPGAFFLDIRDAVNRANLLSRGLAIKHFSRPAAGLKHRNRPKKKKAYQLGLNQLEQALKSNGHVKLK
jgi:hypothetical protein